MGGMASSQSRDKLIDLEARELETMVPRQSGDDICIRRWNGANHHLIGKSVKEGKAAKKPGKLRRGGRGVDAVSYRQMRNWKVHLQSTETFPRDEHGSCFSFGPRATSGFFIPKDQADHLEAANASDGTPAHSCVHAAFLGRFSSLITRKTVLDISNTKWNPLWHGSLIAFEKASFSPFSLHVFPLPQRSREGGYSHPGLTQGTTNESAATKAKAGLEETNSSRTRRNDQTLQCHYPQEYSGLRLRLGPVSTSYRPHIDDHAPDTIQIHHLTSRSSVLPGIRTRSPALAPAPAPAPDTKRRLPVAGFALQNEGMNAEAPKKIKWSALCFRGPSEVSGWMSRRNVDMPPSSPATSCSSPHTMAAALGSTGTGWLHIGFGQKALDEKCDSLPTSVSLWRPRATGVMDVPLMIPYLGTPYPEDKVLASVWLPVFTSQTCLSLDPLTAWFMSHSGICLGATLPACQYLTKSPTSTTTITSAPP
ncbi:uncharacterized protein CLUP02_12579 [Colletotrichum lupini]|uniref:Uncharacterized protein n=1 Tax=Colletotrichum lupini TaxID=145971 RepID=A0A9Q8T2H7_9PEZI|nr:uncharacterized protein CLUP02_12579 [Colletotrichum lupini]UQC87077.1 hypothetical protein CLUP02_12579 [Colletotrichum lupini]